jgi:hypothetical protein
MSVQDLSAGAANMFNLLSKVFEVGTNKILADNEDRTTLILAKLSALELTVKSVEARLSVLELNGAKKIAPKAVEATVKTEPDDEPMVSDEEEKPEPTPTPVKKRSAKKAPTSEPKAKATAKPKAKAAVKPRAVIKATAKDSKDSLKTDVDGNSINGYTQFCRWAVVHRDDFRDEFLTDDIQAELAKVPAIAKCDDELERRVLEGEHYWSKLASEDAKKEIKARFNQWKVERKKVNDAVEVDQADSEEE